MQKKLFSTLTLTLIQTLLIRILFLTTKQTVVSRSPYPNFYRTSKYVLSKALQIHEGLASFYRIVYLPVELR